MFGAPTGTNGLGAEATATTAAANAMFSTGLGLGATFLVRLRFGCRGFAKAGPGDRRYGKPYIEVY